MKKLNCLATACVLGLVSILGFKGKLPSQGEWTADLPVFLANLLNVGVIIVVLYGILYLLWTIAENRKTISGGSE